MTKPRCGRFSATLSAGTRNAIACLPRHPVARGIDRRQAHHDSTGTTKLVVTSREQRDQRLVGVRLQDGAGNLGRRQSIVSMPEAVYDCDERPIDKHADDVYVAAIAVPRHGASGNAALQGH